MLLYIIYVVIFIKFVNHSCLSARDGIWGGVEFDQTQICSMQVLEKEKRDS